MQMSSPRLVCPIEDFRKCYSAALLVALFVANVQVTVGGVLFPIRIPERRLIAREARDFLAKRSRDLPEQL